MEKIDLKVEERKAVGKDQVKKLRKLGFIPAVVYRGKTSTNLKVPYKEFLQAINTKAGENVIINLQIESLAPAKPEAKPTPASLTSKNAIIKEIQYHPVKGDVLHVDFNEISLTEVITVEVPIAVKGEALGVKEGGVLEHVLWEIEIECLPTQIPENIPVDVSGLKIGDSILVKDLALAKEIKVLTDSEATVIAVAAPRAEDEAKPAEETLAEPEVIREKKLEEAPAEEAEAEKPKEAKK